LSFWLVFLLAVAAAVAFVFRGTILGTHSGGRQMGCISRMKVVTHGLKAYSTQRGGALPPSLDALFPTYLQDRTVLRCPFDRRPLPAVSYEYIPPGKQVVDRLGRQVILYCGVSHPDGLGTADGEPVPSVVPAVLADFSVVCIPKDRFEFRQVEEEH